MPTSVREYAILYVGGKAVISGAIIGGGNGVLTTGQHALDGPEHTGQLPADRVSYDNTTSGLTATDAQAALDELVAATDSAIPFDHPSMGATETIDIADGTWHRGTLDADCTITVTGFTVDEGLVLLFECTNDGTGNHAITWDPDVVFVGDDQPDQTASATTVFLLFSSAGDSLIYGAKVGGATVAALDDLTDVTITTPAEDEQLQYVSGQWVNNARRWEPVTFDPGTGPEIVFDSTDVVMTWKAY